MGAMSGLDVALRFNDAINARDLSALEPLMTDDHRFIDSAGTTVLGKGACLAAWRGFFASFPDYRNEFAYVEARAGIVTVRGRSRCSAASLDGPARWTILVRDGRVSEWRVHAG
jgi:ketosteroid isomerase-like protein